MSGPPLTPLPPPYPVPDPRVARETAAAAARRLEATMVRASSFSEDEQHRRIDDEWSSVESLRHLVFVIDVWLSRTIRGEEDPFHPMGLPPHFMPQTLPGSSIDPDVRPSFDDACDALRGRLADLGRYVAEVSQDELDRPITGHAETVAGGLGVIFNELNFHDGFMNRDLDIIEGSRA